MSFRHLLFEFFPPAASKDAGSVDALFIFLCVATFLMVFFIATIIITFAIRYRRSQRPEIPPKIAMSIPLEIIWTVIPLGIFIFVYAWGAQAYLDRFSVGPSDAYEVFVLGKQWMWQFEHPNGRREIGELHLPLGKPIRFLMISQDVIHDAFIPAFRIKHDVLPMAYSTFWFEPTLTGKFHLFCSQYCGTEHSQMTAWVYVMKPTEFQTWLEIAPGQNSPSSTGKNLLEVLQCRTCHRSDSLASAPSLEGLYGGPVPLDDGTFVTADVDYIRRSILDPASQIVSHYKPVMPSYRGRITEDQILHIISYLKSVPSRERGP